MKPNDPWNGQDFPTHVPGPYLGLREAPASFSMERDPAELLSSDRVRTVALLVTGNTVEATKIVHAIVPKSSLSRRGTLTPYQSEQTERLSHLFAYAFKVFDDLEEARLFMRRPHPELAQRSPIEAAMSERGGRAVESILDSLAFGLPV